MEALRCKSALCQLSCGVQSYYLSHREYIIYCYEPGVRMYSDTYHYTTFPALFLSRLIWKSMIPVCKHPKTITIVTDNRQRVATDLHLFIYLCTFCLWVCWRAFYTTVCLQVQKHTLTHVSWQMCKAAGNPRVFQHGFSLPAPQLEAHCAICVSLLP